MICELHLNKAVTKKSLVATQCKAGIGLQKFTFYAFQVARAVVATLPHRSSKGYIENEGDS